VILDPDGYIMTNAHVVEGARQIRVVLPSPVATSPLDVAPAGKRKLLDAKLVGEDKDIDLALLKVEGHNFPMLPLETERPAHPGQLVVAIGSPSGLENSVTMGVVSSVWRQADPEKPMVYLQTDAPINPGSSGGPLVDLDGYVLGMNTFILTESGGSEGLVYLHPPDEKLAVDVLRGSRSISLNISAMQDPDPMDRLADLVDPKNRIGRLGIFALDFTPQFQSLMSDIRLPSGHCGRTESWSGLRDSGLSRRKHNPCSQPHSNRVCRTTAVRSLSAQVWRSGRVAGRTPRETALGGLRHGVNLSQLRSTTAKLA
jgi:hypothetical protein